MSNEKRRNDGNGSEPLQPVSTAGVHQHVGRLGNDGSHSGGDRPNLSGAFEEISGGTEPDSQSGNAYQGRGAAAEYAFLQQIGLDAAQPPMLDGKCAAKWPTLQICLRTVRTLDGRARAGGELKTVAKGINYATTLVMPEEGQQVSVVHGKLSDAWDAIEAALTTNPVPWIECSEFALKRAKRRNDRPSK